MAFVSDLRRLQSKAHLLTFLAIDEKSFDSIVGFQPGAAKDFDEVLLAREITFPIFFRHDIPKKNRSRGFRTVWEVVGPEKYIYKALSRQLDGYFKGVIANYPHPSAFGYVSGRNISKNAANHSGQKRLMSVDLEDFFPSISESRVCGLFVSTGIADEVSRLLAGFLTIGGKLPLGLASSPVVANAICAPLDDSLKRLADGVGAVYSRYADDLAFSANNELPDIEEVRSIVAQNGFSIADKKTRRSVIGQAHYVTGLSVSDPERPHIPRSKKRRLRQEMYYAKKHSLEDHLSRQGFIDDQTIQQAVNRLDGMVKFAAFHEPKLAARLKSTWAGVLRESSYKPSFKPKNFDGAPFVLVFDEAEFGWNGRRCLALGISVSQHQDRVDLATEEVLQAALSDVWADGNREAIRKRGIHFADATEDLRLRYVDVMRTLPFEGYVAFGALGDAAEYEATYLRLLNSIIKRRLMAAESRSARLVFEENSKVGRAAIEAAVKRACQDLAKHDNRRPEECFVGFASKPASSLSVPDFLLGVLGKYLRSGPDGGQEPIPREKLMFERLRDKYRLILDFDSRTEYSRRKPISP